ncbi:MULTISPECIES: hypothetical protein [Actinopolyspora]|uniref:Uncharacterized protein n=1 Tax=Actinopolyspora biskrensis TaxID=1470178 RepID=A0A852YTV8_9ACTN|nr:MULTISPECIES: hypothetical protein [Actinopolyspora]NYH77162.1 hypothetical protein [Actinopolyspora biskrensis]
MSLHVVITRFDNIIDDPQSRVLWRETHQGVDALRTLEILAQACYNVLAEETTVEITQEATGRALTRNQLIRVAYACATSPTTPHSYRERFAAWFCLALGEILYPWDDGAPFPDPPLQYWDQAACWMLQELGPAVAPWLTEAIEEAYPGGSVLSSLVSQHAADPVPPDPACPHYRHQRHSVTAWA